MVELGQFQRLGEKTGHSCVVAANRLGLTDRRVKVFVPGGTLQIELDGGSVFMTGPAELSFKGEVDV